MVKRSLLTYFWGLSFHHLTCQPVAVMDKQALPWQSFWQSLISHSRCSQERSRLLFPLSPFATVVEVQSHNCDTSSQQLLKCSRTSQTSANAADFFSQDLEFGFWTCV